MNVSIGSAKNNLAKLIRLAEGGETITIERHGRPVAQLRALPSALHPQKDEALAAAFNEVLCPAYLKNILRS
jgi:antitoxin (DNA-binding transcriptional repressor) of toxin-antitoxin stability system